MAARLYDWQGYGRYLPDNDAESALCTAICVGTEAAFQVAENPSLWSDPVNAPDELIRGMARRAGLRGAEGQTIVRLRDRLINPPSFEVGSTEAIAESVRGLLTPDTPGTPADVRVRSNSDPSTYPAPADLHTTVIVRPTEAAGVSDDALQAAAELGAPGWVVIHIVRGAGESIDELSGTIDSYTSPIEEL